MSRRNFSPYLLQELPDITDSINYPIKNVQRIKVSTNILSLAFVQNNLANCLYLSFYLDIYLCASGHYFMGLICHKQIKGRLLNKNNSYTIKL